MFSGGNNFDSYIVLLNKYFLMIFSDNVFLKNERPKTNVNFMK